MVGPARNKLRKMLVFPPVSLQLPVSARPTNPPSRRTAALHALKPRFRSTSSTPTPFVTCANRNGPSPRIFFASRSMTPRSAPTSGARSVLLMTSRSDCVMPGPALARDLVAARHVDHVDRVVGQLAAELRGEIVAAALDEQQFRLELLHQPVQRLEVLADVVAHRRVRTAAGLDRGDPLRRAAPGCAPGTRHPPS